MSALFSLVEQYIIEGKDTHKPIRRILNFILSASIASFLFEKLYFKYEWIDFSNYKALLDFIKNGYFFLPLFLFILSHYGMKSLSQMVFALTAIRKKDKLLNLIRQFGKPKKKVGNNSQTEAPALVLLDDIDNSIWTKLYYQAKASISEKIWHDAEQSIGKLKKKFENDFNLVFKALIATFIYYIKQSFFGIWSLLTTVIILFIILVAILGLYVIIAVLPPLLKKVEQEIQYLINSILSDS